MIGVIGGDRRQAELGKLLSQDGHTIRTYGLDRWAPVGPGPLEEALAAEADSPAVEPAAAAGPAGAKNRRQSCLKIKGTHAGTGMGAFYEGEHV